MGSVKIKFDLRGLGVAACATAGNAKNSCGIHIHAGSSCKNSETQGGHFWNKAFTPEDPWKSVTFSEFVQGDRAAGSVSVNYYEPSSVGRVLIVHDRNGARVACSKITDGTRF